LSWKIEDDYTVDLFGKKFNSLAHGILTLGYFCFLMLPWPIISGSPWLLTAIFPFIPMFIAEFVYNEIIPSLRLYRFLAIGFMLLSTFIFTKFVIDKPLIVDLLHFGVFMLWYYILYKRHLAVPVD